MRGPDDTLTSELLYLRRFTWDDLEPLVELHTDPEVTRYIGGGRTREQVETLLRERILAYYDLHPGLGIWATHARSTGAWLGFHLLNHIRGEEHLQVGYVLTRAAWGRGYATEMCQRLVRYGFEELGLRQLVGITDLPNLASQRVLLKVGLRRRGERIFSHYGPAPLAWFERDADDWLAERAASSG